MSLCFCFGKSTIFYFLPACQGQWEWMRLQLYGERYYLDIQSVFIKVESIELSGLQKAVYSPRGQSRRQDHRPFTRTAETTPVSPAQPRWVSDFMMHLCRCRNWTRNRGKGLPATTSHTEREPWKPLTHAMLTWTHRPSGTANSCLPRVFPELTAKGLNAAVHTEAVSRGWRRTSTPCGSHP